MTKKLEELFQMSPEPESLESIPEYAQETTEDALTTLDRINAALPQVRGLDASDTEMDDLAAMAVNSYKDLSDLGMQVESRFASEIFNAAGTMLGHAITAKTAKMNKKLKMIEMQLKKATLDQKVSAKEEEIDAVPLGTGQKLDRNELLKMLAGGNLPE